MKLFRIILVLTSLLLITNCGAPTKKVDINYLLAKVRREKNKEKKENYILLSLICGVVAVTGIIASF